MTPPNDLPSLLCVERLGELAALACPSLQLDGRRSGVLLFHGEVDVAAIRRVGLTVLRLLDEYHIVYESKDRTTRTGPELLLFDLLAANYESTIEIGKNRRVIHALLSMVCQPGRPQLILDYGCGTGLSIQVALPSAVQLLAFDRSRAMRAIARSRGLRVINETQLIALEPRSIDGIIASYVLHLAAGVEDLALAAGKLAPQGRLAANFHKGLGMIETNNILVLNGFARETAYESREGYMCSWIRLDY
jgi:SAM-dependent methyltransferase